MLTNRFSLCLLRSNANVADKLRGILAFWVVHILCSEYFRMSQADRIDPGAFNKTLHINMNRKTPFAVCSVNLKINGEIHYAPFTLIPLINGCHIPGTKAHLTHLSSHLIIFAVRAHEAELKREDFSG